MSNAQERGMREFWLEFASGIMVGSANHEIKSLYEGGTVIHCREIDPSAPDYKVLVDNMARALEGEK